MHARVFTLLFLYAAISLAQDTNPPELSPTEKAMVAWQMRDAGANFVTACIDVTREAARERLTIYAVVPVKTATVKHEGYEIEVIYHPDLARQHADVSGAYHHHHNALVLNFAAAEFVAGRKELGLRLVRLLAKAQPEMWWSSPTHAPLTLKKILAGLEKNDDSIKQYLEDEAKEWKDRVKRYGP